MKQFLLLVALWSAFGTLPIANAGIVQGEKRIFTITGYYSPLPIQDFYITGSYEAEIALNGRGANGADGTPVFPGMIAAPKSFPFGTKIRIPGLGTGAVHDRGGAIVHQGERDLARFDRLDIWMGYGDEGLRRALAFGVQHLESEVFSVDAPVAVGMNFSVPPMLQDIVSLPQRPVFASNLSFGAKGENVKVLQDALQSLRLYAGEINGVFDQTLEESIFQFQKKNFIVEDRAAFGAGVFGPSTRTRLTSVLYERDLQEALQKTWEKFHFDEDLMRGARNSAVLRLQQILVQHEFLTVAPTGLFGPQTEEALTRFQLALGLIERATDSGAGKVGPSTREKLNEILEAEKSLARTEADQIFALQSQHQVLATLAGKDMTLSFAQK